MSQAHRLFSILLMSNFHIENIHALSFIVPLIDDLCQDSIVIFFIEHQEFDRARSSAITVD